ncbi:oligosaccharide flippase family protein [Thermoflexus sp.]|uniref:oligosaccharide flippase family protein n=1 Tax=Thermoflexus sp. TaxID=1969742 RepID=UPI0035E45D18
MEIWDSGSKEGTPVERSTTGAPLASSAVRGGMWVALSTYWTLAFGFAANILLTRTLPPEAFGAFALAMFFAQLLRLQTKLGLGYAFGQYKETTGESVGTYVVLEGVAALSGLLLMGLAAPALRFMGYDPLVVQIALVLSFAAFLEGISAIAGTLLEKELRFGLTSLYQGLVFPLSYLPAFWLAAHGGGAWSLAAQTTVYSLLGLGLWGVARWRMSHLWAYPWRFRRDLAGHFLRFGAAAGLWLMAGMLFSQLDNFLIGTFAGVTALGYYDRAYRMAQWPALLFNAVLTRTAFYTYARLQDDRARLEKTVAMVTWAISMIAIPVALAIFLAARDLVVLLYGERWLPSVLFLQILSAFFVLRPHLEHAGVVLNAMGRPGRAAALLWAQVGVLGVAGLPLTMRWGALGACGAVGLALIAGIGLACVYTRRELSVSANAGLGMPLLAGGATILGYIIVLRFIPLENLGLFTRLVVKAIYAFSAFYVLAFAMQPRAVQERVRYVWRLAREAGHEM